MNNEEENIVSISKYNLMRKQLENIEKNYNIKDKSFYNKILNEIAVNRNSIDLIETLYLDSFLLLNFKKNFDIISTEDRRALSELYRLFITDKASIIISFYTNERVRNNIIKSASEYRKNNPLSKARMIYMLDDISLGLFSNLEFEITSELHSYDFDMNYITNYIYNNLENKDLTNQLYNYFKFLFLYDIDKYTKFIKYIEFKIKDTNKKSKKQNLIDENMVKEFIKSVSLNQKEPKIFKIKKTGE